MKTLQSRARARLVRVVSLLAVVPLVSGCALVLGYDGMAFKDEPEEATVQECVPYTCAELGAQCGVAEDGCGGVTLCGVCPEGQTCGGGGPNVCGSDACTPATCASLGADCATVSDGCGGTLACGSCAAPLSCGGGGVANQCGCQGQDCAPPCVPASCAQMGAECGSIDDGCGGVLSCGGCGSGEQCGGAGKANQCGAPTEHHEALSVPGGYGGDPGGMIPVCCVPSEQEKKFIERVFELLNEHRQKHGRAPLKYDDKLEQAIVGHCHHMAAHGFFSHNAPEKSVRDFWQRAKACGTGASAENIAVGQQTPEEVMHTWRFSAGHNANMLGNYTRVGIGFYAGGSWGTYWGQIFD